MTNGEGQQGAPRGNEMLTPREQRRREFETLKKLFGFELSFEDIVGDDKSRPASLIRHVLMWAHARGKDNPTSLSKTARMYGREHHVTVLDAVRGLNSKASRNLDPEFDEKLELLLEASVFIVDKKDVPEEMQKRIAELRSSGAFTDEKWALGMNKRRKPAIQRPLDYQGPGRLKRENAALALIQQNKTDAEIMESLNISRKTLWNYKDSLIMKGLLEKDLVEKRGAKIGPNFRGIDDKGNTLLALTPEDILIADLRLKQSKTLTEICEELLSRGIEKTRGSVIGRVWRVFGGLDLISEDRFVRPKEPGGEVLYKKPPADVPSIK